MNYKLSITYNGSKYHGWAMQPDVVTVHSTLNQVIRQLFDVTPVINASGRTDAYVHALEQVINMKHEKLNLAPAVLLTALNSRLPDDIRVTKCEQAPNDFHARYHCLNKTYNYLIETSSNYNVMQHELVYQYNKPIDETKLKVLFALFLGSHDFLSFSTTTLANTTRTINSLELSWHNSILCISINANGFLRNMVRMIIGVCLAYNDDKISLNDIKKLLLNPAKGSAKFKAYACGLYLVKPFY